MAIYPSPFEWKIGNHPFGVSLSWQSWLGLLSGFDIVIVLDYHKVLNHTDYQAMFS